MKDGLRSDTGGEGIVTRQLAVVGVLVVLVALAGCTGALSDDAGEPADHAPDGSDVLVHLDMSMMESEENQQLFEALADEDEAVDDQEDLVSEFEDETGLDLRESQQVLLFAEVNDDYVEEQVGFIVYSDWETESVIEAIEDDEDTEFERTEYNGEEVLFEPVEEPEWGQATYVGVLGDGQFVVGTEESVTNSLDVEYGDAESVSGDVRKAYDDATDGYVTVAAAPPTENIPDDDPSLPDEVSLEPFQNLNAFSAVYYTGDGNVGFETKLYTEDEDTALDVYDVINGGVSFASGTVEDDDLTDQLRAIEIDQDGSTVTVTYQSAVDDIVELIEEADL